MLTPSLPRCVIITGPPAAGKSTVSRLVAAQLPRSARLDGDVVVSLIVNGGVWALGEPAEEAARQVELTNRNLTTLASNFAAAGFTPVIDWVIPDRAQLDFFVEQLHPFESHLVVLAPTEPVCRLRNAQRPEHERWEFTGHHRLLETMREGFGDQGQWIDSSDHTPQATADHILRRVLRP